MLPEPIEPGSAIDWLQHARSDLAIAQSRKTTRVLYAHLCFHAQQAAEKALKAVLVSERVSFSRSHDMAYLLGLLPQSRSIPPALIELPLLNKYAVQYRYPGEMLPVSATQRKQAVRLAEAAIDWASYMLRHKPKACRNL
jgi:HEPN domain-containing protein